MRHIFMGGRVSAPLSVVAAGVAAAALAMMAIIPPSVHIAQGEEPATSLIPDVTVSNYDELANAINSVGANQSSVIDIAGDISFLGQLTVDQGKKITLVSDNDACGTACGLGYSGTNDYSLFNVVGGAALTVGGGTDETNKLSFSDQKNGRLVQVGSDDEEGTVIINGGAYSNNGSTSNTTGDGNIAYVFKNGNLTINGGEFANNYVFHAGDSPTIGVSRSGGAVVRSSGSVTINGGTFYQNYTGENGRDNVDFHGGGAIWSDGTLIVNGGEFVANVSRAVHYTASWKRPTGGGAIWAAGSLVINGGTFKDNWQMDNTTLYATGGGAIYFGDGTKDASYNGSMVINGGTFDSNRSMQDGGAIFMAWNCEAVFQQGTFVNNWSNRLGGAVYTEEDSTSYVTNAAAYGNYAGHFGGGLWLCPSGKSKTSNHAGMALFDNVANTQYDRTETGAVITQNMMDGKNYGYSGSRNWGVSGAGDDFSIMYPNKSGQTNYYELSVEWFTGDRIAWHDDGEPTMDATGYLYSAKDLGVNAMERLTGGNEYSEDAVLDPGPNTGVLHGYGLKVTQVSDEAKQNAKDQAFITFTNNTARLSGGAFGSNGQVDFIRAYDVSWSKASTEDAGKSIAGSKWVLVAQKGSGPHNLDFGDVTDCTADDSGSLTPSEDAWCLVPTDTTDGYYAEFAGMYVTIVSDNGTLDKNSADGQFRVSGLRVGTYFMKEYQAPEWYEQSNKTYTFDVKANATATISVYKDDGKITGDVADGNAILNRPYGAVGWGKADSTDRLTILAGSEWKLQDADGNDIQGAENITDCTGQCFSSLDDPYHDVDSAEGSFRLMYLPVGTYRLVETKAPEGYDLPDGATVYYTFTIQDDDSRKDAKLYDANGSEVAENKVPNDRTKGQVVWYKTDSTKEGSGENARLAGSEWTLTQVKDWQGNDIAEPVSEAVTDCIGDAQCPADSKDRDAKAGVLQLQGLDWGTYELVETKAPNGYTKSDVTYTFVIDKTNNGNAEIQIMNGADPVTGNIITNTPITVSSLPFTGSSTQTPRVFVPYVLGAVGGGLALGLGLHVARRRMARQG